MKNKKVAGLCGLLLLGLVITACEMGGRGDLKYSIQVNNQLSARSMISAEDTVELYIHHFEYREDAARRVLIIIANGDRDMGSEDRILNNAGWYSVDADLAVSNYVNDGPYSSFLVGMNKLRVNGTEYDFPGSNFPLGMGNGNAVIFGNPSNVWEHDGEKVYPDNFDGINIDSSTISLKTVLTVYPDILGTGPGYNADGLAEDPYQYITVEGRINE
jgi:hypothetical protein